MLQTVPREHFVADEYQSLAFADTSLPLTDSPAHTMLKPQLEGRILQVLAPQADERVLQIGTGSGYLAACLARLAASTCQRRKSRISLRVMARA